MKINTNKVLEIVKAEFGEPDKTYSYSITHKDDLRIVLYYPEQKDDRYGTLILTVGFFNHLTPKQSGYSELSVHLNINPDVMSEQTIIENFANVVKEIISKELLPNRGSIIKNDQLFKNYNYLINAKNTVYEGFDVSDKNQEYRIEIDRLLPLTDIEYNNLKTVNENDRTIVLSEVDEFPDSNNSSTGSFTIENAIDKIWLKILEWHKKHNTYFGKNIDKENHPDQIKIDTLEQKSGLKLPSDLKYFLSKYQIKLPLNEYSIVLPNDILDLIQNPQMKHLQKNGPFIPFAEDSGGNMIGILNKDEPSLCYFEVDEGFVTSKQKSFLEWLYNYKNDLVSNSYKIDEEGFLYAP
jgi:hypothetical protein